MPRLISLIGQRFGRLTVMARAPYERRFGLRVAWLCQCDCGTQKAIVGPSLTQRGTESCGCLRRELMSAMHSTHRMTESPTYQAWCHAKRRCFIPSDKSWPRYGGRGIRMSEEWASSFEAFYRDMGPRPSAQHSLDRIDNNGHYERGNCRWATPFQQASNTRKNRYLEYDGKRMTLNQWARTLNVHHSLIQNRIKRGWSIEQALTTPRLNHNQWNKKGHFYVPIALGE